MCYSQARTWGLRGTFSKLNFLRNLLLKFECGHKESVSNVDPFRTWRPKKQLDGWGERAWDRRSWKQRRDSIAADQASHLVDGRASRQQVFLRRMRVKKGEKPHCWVRSIGTNPPSLPPSSGSPFNAQTRPDSLYSDHSSAKSESSNGRYELLHCEVEY